MIHGTDAGYAKHRRRGEHACAACREAHAAANRISKARPRAPFDPRTVAVTALRHLAEAVKANRRAIVLGPSTAKVNKALRKMWRAQRIAIVAHLRTKRSAFDGAESLREANVPSWESRWGAIENATRRDLETTLDAQYPKAMGAGASHAIADCAAVISFSVKHPDAVAWLADRSAERVAAINATTRDGLRTLLSNAVDEGWSWTRTARAIEAQFAGFSGSVPQSFLRTRAELVAVTEMAEAYEHGQSVVRSDLAKLGLAVEKSWLTVGDDRVSTDCLGNQGQGWIPNADSFGSGASSPPEHPGCRCTSLSRVNTEGE